MQSLANVRFNILHTIVALRGLKMPLAEVVVVLIAGKLVQRYLLVVGLHPFGYLVVPAAIVMVIIVILPLHLNHAAVRVLHQVVYLQQGTVHRLIALVEEIVHQVKHAVFGPMIMRRLLLIVDVNNLFQTKSAEI